MTMLDTGTYGAKIQSWRNANPRDLLKRLLEKNPTANKETVFAAFREKLHGDKGEGFLESIIEYWFANNYHSLVARPAAPRDRAAKRVAVEKVKAAIKVAAKRMVLLEMVMPNGKALRDCTGKECAKAGGWFTKIAGQIKPTEVVGAVLSEEELRALYGR